LGFVERDPVLFRVLCILEAIPFKVPRYFHGVNVIQTHAIVNRKKRGQLPAVYEQYA
jgi:hypothetical protein